jgi:hypothetical protein
VAGGLKYLEAQGVMHENPACGIWKRWQELDCTGC